MWLYVTFSVYGVNFIPVSVFSALYFPPQKATVALKIQKKKITDLSLAARIHEHGLWFVSTVSADGAWGVVSCTRTWRGMGIV